MWFVYYLFLLCRQINLELCGVNILWIVNDD